MCGLHIWVSCCTNTRPYPRPQVTGTVLLVCVGLLGWCGLPVLPQLGQCFLGACGGLCFGHVVIQSSLGSANSCVTSINASTFLLGAGVWPCLLVHRGFCPLDMQLLSAGHLPIKCLQMGESCHPGRVCISWWCACKLQWVQDNPPVV
jgi:hypothetical protein